MIFYFREVDRREKSDRRDREKDRKRSKRSRSRKRDKRDKERDKRDKDRRERKPEVFRDGEIKIKEEPIDGEFDLRIYLYCDYKQAIL